MAGFERQPEAATDCLLQFVEIAGRETLAIMTDFYGVQMLTHLDSRRVIQPDAVPREQISLIEF